MPYHIHTFLALALQINSPIETKFGGWVLQSVTMPTKFFFLSCLTLASTYSPYQFLYLTHISLNCTFLDSDSLSGTMLNYRTL
jgi:hypothetical protein